MRVFLDTNVLAAAMATRGLCADVVRHVLTLHELLTCTIVLSELERVLHDKLGLPETIVNATLVLLRESAEIVKNPATLDLEVADRADRRILSDAVEGAAEFFVTGDRELSDLGTIQNMRIVTPRKFWEHVAAQGDTQP